MPSRDAFYAPSWNSRFQPFQGLNDLPITGTEELTMAVSSLSNRIKVAPVTAAIMFPVAGALAVACTYTPIAHRADL
jgi:hypothetical protein